MNKFIDILKKTFSLDYRSIALMRIAIASVILIDLCVRASDITAFYTNEGVLPTDILKNYVWDSYKFSFHAISGSYYWQVFLFSISFFFGILLLLGYYTRIAGFMSWLLLLSIQNRNPMILQGGDDLLRLILFWGMFLPWGKRYSIDSIHSIEKKSSYNTFFNLANIAYVFQIATLFIFAALIKDSEEWHTTGTAIYYALSLDQITLPLGKYIYHYPTLLKSLTFIVYYTELIIPFLLFVPFFNSYFRMFATACLMLLNIAFGSTLYVGLFFIICICSMIGLIPTLFIEHIDKNIALIAHKLKVVMIKIPYHTTSFFKTNKMILFYAQKIRYPFLLLCFLYSVMWGFATTPLAPYAITNKAKSLGLFLRLDSYWGMFSPSVFKDDGWYVLEATTNNETTIDINKNGNPVNYAKPENIVSSFKNDRWRKYSENYLFVSNSYIRPLYCSYMMKQWNQNHPEKLIKHLKVLYIKEVSLPNYQYSEPSKDLLWECNK